MNNEYVKTGKIYNKYNRIYKNNLIIKIIKKIMLNQTKKWTYFLINLYPCV